METIEKTEHKGLNVYKTVKNDPQYFGGYLNMARHNVFLLINHLTEAFSNLKNIDDEQFSLLNDDEEITSSKHLLSQIFNPEVKKFEQDRIRVYSYLIKRHHLPFLKIFDLESVNIAGKESSGVDFGRLHNFILASFKMINDLRNSYSHFLAIDDKGNKITKRSNIVDSLIIEDIKLLFKNAPEYSFLRNKETQTEEDYKHLDKYEILVPDTCLFTDQGLYFFINLFLERNHATKFLKKFSGFKNETTPPFRATIQAFTSYALKVPDVRLGNENPQFSLLMDMLSELNRCPKELFNHITEDARKEFEPPLNEEGKHNVALNSTNYEDVTDEEIDGIIKDLTAKKRYNDRFPYFALRFLDETNALPNIRFQITIGKLIVKRYDKEIAGVVGDRRVIKTINAFGRLSDFLDNEINVLAELKQNFADDDDIQFEQFSPHYNTNNNKIAFCIFNPNDDKIKYPSVFENKETNTDAQNNPDGFISVHDLPKLLLLSHLAPREPEKSIIDFLHNVNAQLFDKSELDKIRKLADYSPGFFTKRINKENDLISAKGVQYLSKEKEYQLLKDLRLSKKELVSLDKRSLEKRIRNKTKIEYASQIKYQYYLQQRIEELKKHLPKELKFDMLPAKVHDYLMNIEELDSKKRIHNKVKAIRDEAKELKKKIESEIEKQKNEQHIKLGELATFVARDIIKMVVCKEVKDKITTPYYNKLQTKIAYFSLNKNELIAVCEELHLFDYKKGHVFLSKRLITSSTGIIDFTLKYLTVKDRWIENNLLEKGKKGGYRLPNGKTIPLSFEKIVKDVNSFDFNSWLKSKSQMPVDLPNSIFDAQLEKILKGRLSAKGTLFNEGDKFSVLLSKYLGDDTQPFYKYTRSYNINKKPVEFNLQGKSGKELKSEYGIPVEKNEKLIRFIQAKDRILKLLCDKLLSLDKTVGLQDGFSLSEIHPNAERNPLERPAAFQQRITSKGNEVYCNIIAKDSENQIKMVEGLDKLQTPEEREGYQWTFKYFGRFKRFIKDRRIPDLSLYFQNKDIPFDLLEYQIREYNKYREAIFETSFELEKYIAQFDFEGLKQIEFKEGHRPKGFNEVQFEIYLEWLNNKKIQFNKDLLTECRNKFSHSEFPYIKEIQKITKQQMNDFESSKHIKEYKNSSGISIPEKIGKLYSSEIKRIIESINRLQ
ncbi:type VI-B CRISPR-associated RNA-guided ribonuclease Cas13b [Labilibaculum euxinus]